MTQLLCSCRRVVGQATSKTLTAQVPSQTPLALHGPQLLKCGQPMASFVTLGGSHSLTSDPLHPAHDSVSERPRRWTRNPLGSARRGSNPLAVDKSQLRCHRWNCLAQRISRLQKSMLSCWTSKHYSSRAPAFRTPVIDCWPKHARVVTPLSCVYRQPADPPCSTTVCPSG